MKRISGLVIVGIFAVVLTVMQSGYLMWQKSATTKEISVLNAQVEDLKGERLKLENQKVLEAINSKKALNNFQANMIYWSTIIERIIKTIPSDSGGDVVEVLSYSGSGGDSISINVKTRPGSEEPYFDVAEVIEEFDASDYFVDSFVPSISKGTDEEGQEVLSFGMSMKYRNPDAKTEAPSVVR